MINENIKATGRLNIVLTGPDGKVKDKRNVNNLVVDVGKEFIAARMINEEATTNKMTHMALGTLNTSAAAGQTALATEIGTRASISGGGSVLVLLLKQEFLML